MEKKNDGSMSRMSRRDFLKYCGKLSVMTAIAPFLPGCTDASNTPTTQPTPTKEPTSTPTVEATVQHQYPEYHEPQTAEQVAAERGGQARYWRKIDWEVNAQILNPNRQTQRAKLVKSEWVYDLRAGGRMSELKPFAQIPQSKEAVANWLGGNVEPKDVQLFVVVDKGHLHYADWMEKWLQFVPAGTVIGFELIQNKGSDIVPYQIKLQPGVMVEGYDDRQTFTIRDDVAFTLWNFTNKPMPLILSGGSFWPWGNPNKIMLEQHNYNPGQMVEATYYEDTYIPTVASNISSPDTIHRMIIVDANGKVQVSNLNRPFNNK